VLAILGRGDKVIATARRVSDLDYIDQVKGSKDQVHKVVLDVSEPFDQLRKTIDAAVTLFGTIDVLVNNAGFLHCAVWEETRYVPRTGLLGENEINADSYSMLHSHEETMRQFNTNFFGAMNLTRCILPWFRRAKSGVFLFSGSIGGWLGVGAGGAYSASKFALEGEIMVSLSC
jgi:NAD(P)-dependent dehydrogenase (short-subunit alcohol dehydrogenase family)